MYTISKAKTELQVINKVSESTFFPKRLVKHEEWALNFLTLTRG